MVGGQFQLSAQLGHVEIGCDVEIGACSTIDRGTYSATIIGDGTKIDNQVMIAHNCRIGRHNMICSQVGIAGSTTTGDYVVMAGQVGVRDHVHIGSGAVLGAKSGVANDVPDGAQMLGAPAVPIRQQKLQFAHLSRLPEMRQQIKELQRQVEALMGGDRRRNRGQADRAAATRRRRENPMLDRPKIGLVAGWGRYPLVVAEALGRQGYSVCGLGIKEHADESLIRLCDEFTWVGLARMGAAIRFMRRHRVREATLAGKIHKVRLFQPGARLKYWPDWPTVRAFWPHFIAGRKDRRDDSLLLAAVGGLQASGNQRDAGNRLCTGVARETWTIDAPRTIGLAAERHSIRLATGQGTWPARRRSERGREGSGAAGAGGDRRNRRMHSPRGKALSGRRIHGRESRQAAARHAVRRADDRLGHIGDDGGGGRHAVGSRSRADHLCRSSAVHRPGRTAWDHHRRAGCRRMLEPRGGVS